jgi:protoporphyrinogen oxidase
MTRRDLLAAFLGAPFAVAACRRHLPSQFGGTIRGASDLLGHKLREGFRPPPTALTKVGCVIVGAGPSGLSAAWKFTRSHFDDYVVLDLESSPGGTSTWGQNRVSAYPWGAHYVPVPSPRNKMLIQLLLEAGAIQERRADGSLVFAEEQLVRDPEERVFFKGRWYPGLYLRAGASADDLAQLERFTAEMDQYAARLDAKGRRAFDIPMSASSDDPEITALDAITFEEFLDKRGYTSPRLRWFAEYACRDDYGCTLDTTSAWAGVFYYASRAKKNGKYAELLSWPEGNGRLVKHLVSAAATRLRPGTLVTEIVPGPNGVEVHAFDAARNEPVGFQAGHVIFALPKFVAHYLIRPWRDDPPPHLADFTMSPWMVANVTLTDRPVSAGFPAAWDNVLYESPSLGYVVATHQALIDHGPTVWTYYYPLTDHDPRLARAKLLASTWSDWADVLVSDLSRAHHDLARLVETIDVWRWGHGMVRPTPGFLFGPSRRKAADPFGAIHFAHSDLSGMALFEEAQYWGVRAAEAVMTARGISFESSL